MFVMIEEEFVQDLKNSRKILNRSLKKRKLKGLNFSGILNLVLNVLKIKNEIGGVE